jgi:hypothetical protein
MALSKVAPLSFRRTVMGAPRWLTLAGQRVRAQPGASAARRWWPLAAEVGLLALACWAAGNVIRLTAYGASVPNGDVHEYQSYALKFWTVQPLLHHLPVEYPPLTILPFSLTLLPPLHDPVPIFACWMVVFIAAGYLWLRHYASRERAITYAAYLLLGATSTVLARFDIFPALITLLALWAAQRRRFTLAYVLLATGILLKLYPAFLVPLVAIEQWQAVRTPAPVRGRARGRGRHASRRPSARALLLRADPAALRQVARGVGLCVGLVVAVFGVAVLLERADAFSGFLYAGQRPLQIESFPATVLWLGTFAGIPAHDVYSFKSLNYVGTLDVLLAPLSTVALAAGCCYVYWRQLRGRLDIGRAFVACLCVVLVANKILSPQYLIWVLPLVAYVEGFNVLWIFIGLLTTAIYPFLYFAHSHIKFIAADWRFLPIIALRNILLVIVTIRAIRGHPPQTATSPTLPAGELGRKGTHGPRRQVPAGSVSGS